MTPQIACSFLSILSTCPRYSTQSLISESLVIFRLFLVNHKSILLQRPQEWLPRTLYSLVDSSPQVRQRALLVLKELKHSSSHRVPKTIIHIFRKPLDAKGSMLIDIFEDRMDENIWIAMLDAMGYGAFEIWELKDRWLTAKSAVLKNYIYTCTDVGMKPCWGSLSHIDVDTWVRLVFSRAQALEPELLFNHPIENYLEESQSRTIVINLFESIFNGTNPWNQSRILDETFDVSCVPALNHRWVLNNAALFLKIFNETLFPVCDSEQIIKIWAPFVNIASKNADLYPLLINTTLNLLDRNINQAIPVLINSLTTENAAALEKHIFRVSTSTLCILPPLLDTEGIPDNTDESFNINPIMLLWTITTKHPNTSDLCIYLLKFSKHLLSKITIALLCGLETSNTISYFLWDALLNELNFQQSTLNDEEKKFISLNLCKLHPSTEYENRSWFDELNLFGSESNSIPLDHIPQLHSLQSWMNLVREVQEIKYSEIIEATLKSITHAEILFYHLCDISHVQIASLVHSLAMSSWFPMLSQKTQVRLFEVMKLHITEHSYSKLPSAGADFFFGVSKCVDTNTVSTSVQKEAIQCYVECFKSFYKLGPTITRKSSFPRFRFEWSKELVYFVDTALNLRSCSEGIADKIGLLAYGMLWYFVQANSKYSVPHGIIEKIENFLEVECFNPRDFEQFKIDTEKPITKYRRYHVQNSVDKITYSYPDTRTSLKPTFDSVDSKSQISNQKTFVIDKSKSHDVSPEEDVNKIEQNDSFNEDSNGSDRTQIIARSPEIANETKMETTENTSHLESSVENSGVSVNESNQPRSNIIKELNSNEDLLPSTIDSSADDLNEKKLSCSAAIQLVGSEDAFESQSIRDVASSPERIVKFHAEDSQQLRILEDDSNDTQVIENSVSSNKLLKEIDISLNNTNQEIQSNQFAISNDTGANENDTQIIESYNSESMSIDKREEVSIRSGKAFQGINAEESDTAKYLSKDIQEEQIKYTAEAQAEEDNTMSTQLIGVPAKPQSHVSNTSNSLSPIKLASSTRANMPSVAVTLINSDDEVDVFLDANQPDEAASSIHPGQESVETELPLDDPESVPELSHSPNKPEISDDLVLTSSPTRRRRRAVTPEIIEIDVLSSSPPCSQPGKKRKLDDLEEISKLSKKRHVKAHTLMRWLDKFDGQGEDDDVLQELETKLIETLFRTRKLRM